MIGASPTLVRRRSDLSLFDRAHYPNVLAVIETIDIFIALISAQQSVDQPVLSGTNLEHPYTMSSQEGKRFSNQSSENGKAIGTGVKGKNGFMVNDLGGELVQRACR